MTSYYVRALFVVTPFHAFHPPAFYLILSDILQESNTHGVGLFPVKDIKAGDFNDIDCFGTFVLYDTEKEVHDAIVADRVPWYIVTNDVASMCVSGEVSTPHAALCLVPLPCHFLWYMNSCGTVKRANNVERESTFTPMKWSLEKGPTEGSSGGARARKAPSGKH